MRFGSRSCVAKIVHNFEMVISMLAKLEINFPSAGVFKDSSLHIYSKLHVMCYTVAEMSQAFRTYLNSGCLLEGEYQAWPPHRWHGQGRTGWKIQEAPEKGGGGVPSI